MDSRLEKVCRELGESLSPETVKVVELFLAKNPSYTAEDLKASFELIKMLSEKD